VVLSFRPAYWRDRLPQKTPLYFTTPFDPDSRILNG